jgi:hypothetical protein
MLTSFLATDASLFTSLLTTRAPLRAPFHPSRLGLSL